MTFYFPLLSYIGYYGVSLISQNYLVLYGSLAAHLLQFLFLGFVENPRKSGVNVNLSPLANSPPHLQPLSSS